MESKYIEITLIKSTGNSNVVFEKVLNSVNTYLLRNKGAVSDFNLIKDVVERNTDAIDEEINTLLPIPLYLGLMGTMLGIVIGLFAMPSISDANFEKAIDILIGGVKIAMIASFTGLLLTVLLSGWKYKGAKTKAEGLKNDFLRGYKLTFCQFCRKIFLPVSTLYRPIYSNSMTLLKLIYIILIV